MPHHVALIEYSTFQSDDVDREVIAKECKRCFAASTEPWDVLISKGWTACRYRPKGDFAWKWDFWCPDCTPMHYGGKVRRGT